MFSCNLTSGENWNTGYKYNKIRAAAPSYKSQAKCPSAKINGFWIIEQTYNQ